MNTPRMKEAWDKSSRRVYGFYSSQTPASECASSCYEEGCKLERELQVVTQQRDKLTEILGDMKTLAEITKQRDEAREYRDRLLEEREQWRLSSVCRELVEQRDRLVKVIESASVLIAAKGRHNTMLAYDGLREALQSLTQPTEL